VGGPGERHALWRRFFTPTVDICDAWHASCHLIIQAPIFSRITIMQDEADNTMRVANDTTTLEADVCSAVERGHDVQKIVRQLDAAGRTQAVTGLHLAQATSDLLRQIAAGVLTGVADHVMPGHPQGKGD
jgi:hypothetical protein